MADNNYIYAQDKDFSKRPAVIMNTKEKIVKASKYFEEYLAEILSDFEARRWDSFQKKGEGKNQR